MHVVTALSFFGLGGNLIIIQTNVNRYKIIYFLSEMFRCMIYNTDTTLGRNITDASRLRKLED